MFTALAKVDATGPRPPYERRKFGRVSVADVPSSLGEVRNLSAGGMCVETRTHFGLGGVDGLLRPSALLHLTLLTPLGFIEVSARVAWVRVEGGWLRKTHRAGLEFRDLSLESTTALLVAFRNGVHNAALEGGSR
jgi:hypothetical protein